MQLLISLLTIKLMCFSPCTIQVCQTIIQALRYNKDNDKVIDNKKKLGDDRQRDHCVTVTPPMGAVENYKSMTTWGGLRANKPGNILKTANTLIWQFTDTCPGKKFISFHHREMAFVFFMVGRL